MTLPLVTTQTAIVNNKVDLTLDVQPTLACFDGHFDVTPVLAGVAQVDWAIRLARVHFNMPMEFKGLQSVKFLRLILPPITLVLSLEYLPARGLLKFSYTSADIRYSSGTVALAITAEPPKLGAGELSETEPTR